MLHSQMDPEGMLREKSSITMGAHMGVGRAPADRFLRPPDKKLSELRFQAPNMFEDACCSGNIRCNPSSVFKALTRLCQLSQQQVTRPWVMGLGPDLVIGGSGQVGRFPQNGTDVLGGACLPLLEPLGCEAHSREGIRHTCQDTSRPQPDAMQWGHNMLARENASNSLVAELTHLESMVEVPIFRVVVANFGAQVFMFELNRHMLDGSVDHNDEMPGSPSEARMFMEGLGSLLPHQFDKDCRFGEVNSHFVVLQCT